MTDMRLLTDRRPSAPRLVKILGFAALLLAPGCGAEDHLAQARAKLARGELAAAQELLGEDSGPGAQALRAAISNLADHRGRVQEVLRGLREKLQSENAQETRAKLRDMREQEQDPVAREAIAVELSALVDWIAADRHSKKRKSRERSALEREQQQERALERELSEPVLGQSSAARGAGDASQVDLGEIEWSPGSTVLTSVSDLESSVLDELSAEILSHIRDREWLRALAVIEMSLEANGALVDSFADLRDTVHDLARQESVDLLSVSTRIEESRGIADAREYLLAESSRFPSAGPLAFIHSEISDLELRAEILRLADEMPLSSKPEQTVQQTDVPAAKDDEYAYLVGRASDLGDRGDLAAAMDAWLSAGTLLPPGEARDRSIGHANDLELRLLLRHELIEAAAADPERFLELGISQVTEEGLRLRDEQLTWAELSLFELRKAANAATLSARARLGLILERLTARTQAEVESALAELNDLTAGSEIETYEIWGLLARFRRETIPQDGYVFEAGRWTSAEEIAAREIAERLEGLASKLSGRLATGEREALLQEVAGLGPQATEILKSTLAARLERLFAGLQDRTLERLSEIADLRRDLDVRREEALALIFDSETYFYPYNPPQCPPEKARLYPAVQRRVDELVQAVRDAWDQERSVKLPEKFRKASEEISWIRRVHASLGLSFSMPEGLPDWFWGIDSRLESIDLRSFAWTESECKDLAYNRAIAAYNLGIWKVEREGEAQSNLSEQRQVEVTNAYRVMFGRRSLAWNPKIQVAAQWHSDYMANTGDFGHFEKDPERRTPFDRMRLAGYTQGSSENCAAGGGDPVGAHIGWIHSSGHHRNILMPGHREMASALASFYWTQNFGGGAEFEEHLAPWHD